MSTTPGQAQPHYKLQYSRPAPPALRVCVAQKPAVQGPCHRESLVTLLFPSWFAFRKNSRCRLLGSIQGVHTVTSALGGRLDSRWTFGRAVRPLECVSYSTLAHELSLHTLRAYRLTDASPRRWCPCCALHPSPCSGAAGGQSDDNLRRLWQVPAQAEDPAAHYRRQ